MHGYKNIFNRVLPYTIAYGTVRKTVHVGNTPVKSNRSPKDTTTDDIYLTTKTAIVLVSGMSSMYTWPYYVCKDIYSFERWIRGDPEPIVYDVVQLLLK